MHQQSSAQASLSSVPIVGRYYSSTTAVSKTRHDDDTVGTDNHRLVSILSDNRDELLDRIPIEDVRNFCFIAHVDHGKSSLASRVLELTGNLGLEAQKHGIAAAQNQKMDGPNSNNDNDNDDVDSSGSVTENGTSNSATTSTSSSSDTPSSSSSSSSSSQAQQALGQQKEQIELLDTLSVEQERGITVKASAATMLYRHPSAVGPEGLLLLNMVDTPGHVDFGREVTRSLSFVQGAVLLLDASQGIQAQTWSVYEKVQSLPNPPKLLAALTKVDLDNARPINVALAVSEWLGWDDPDCILQTSARSRIGVADVLDAVCYQVPSPTVLADDITNNDTDSVAATTDDDGDNKSPSSGGTMLRAQVVDSWFDDRGVNCLVQVVAGTLSEGDRISMTTSVTQSFSVQECGILLPKAIRTGRLRRGQMGYVRFGLKDPRQAGPGTILVFNRDANKLSSMELPLVPDSLQSKSVLYASVHPMEGDEFDELVAAVDRLALNDTGLEVAKSMTGATNSEQGGPFLGPGIRVGFQGLLHSEVFRQRLLDEFDLEVIVTPPKVPYEITVVPHRNNKLKEPETTIVEDLHNWPASGTKFTVKEPIVSAHIMAPAQYAGNVMELITRNRGSGMVSKPIDEDTWMFTARMPWAEVVTDFHDELKNATAGMGSLDTGPADPPMEEASLTKVEILLNNESVDPLSFICHRDIAQGQGRKVCKSLEEVLPRQQFVTVIQAKADGKIIASERIRAYRKDVLTTGGSKSVGGGDVSRKKKLLEKQKKGKKRQQATGRVTLSQAAFNSVISRSSS